MKKFFRILTKALTMIAVAFVVKLIIFTNLCKTENIVYRTLFLIKVWYINGIRGGYYCDMVRMCAFVKCISFTENAVDTVKKVALETPVNIFHGWRI